MSILKEDIIMKREIIPSKGQIFSELEYKNELEAQERAQKNQPVTQEEMGIYKNILDNFMVDEGYHEVNGKWIR